MWEGVCGRGAKHSCCTHTRKNTTSVFTVVELKTQRTASTNSALGVPRTSVAAPRSHRLSFSHSPSQRRTRQNESCGYASAHHKRTSKHAAITTRHTRTHTRSHGAARHSVQLASGAARIFSTPRRASLLRTNSHSHTLSPGAAHQCIHVSPTRSARSRATARVGLAVRFSQKRSLRACSRSVRRTCCHAAAHPAHPSSRRFLFRQAPVASRAGPPQTAAQCTNLLAHTAPTPHREDAPRQREHSRVSDSGAPGTRSCHPRCVWVAPCTLHTQHAHPPQHTRRAAGVCKKTHANPHAAALVAPVTAPASPSPPHRCAT